jgi:putative ABC transport system permease protein
MDSMFGLSTNTIMFVLLGVFAFTLSSTLLIFFRNRLAFVMGLRNIPRRVAQSVLIVIGLMLSTVIITAAFTTGDTVDYSITKATYDLAGHADIILDGEIANDDGGSQTDSMNIAGDEYERFLEAADAADLPDVDGYTGLLLEPVPVINSATRLSEPSMAFVGIDDTRLDAFPDLIDADTGEVLSFTDLAEDEVYMNETGQEELNAKAGEVINVFVQSQQFDYTVRAIVKDTLVGGALDFTNKQGIAAPLSRVQELFNEDEVTAIIVSANGGIRDSLGATERAETQINGLIFENQLRMEVSDTKAGLVDQAEEIANFMTFFFLILGLFSISAGILLIVMLFVMLAAERRSEMGMARAVGMKRRHLIEMFVAEGTGYNLASAIVGVTLGVAVAFLLAIAASSLFETFGFSFTPHVTLRTIIISYTLGVILTFFTVSFSSWRVSTLNIVSAIRDTPEYSNKRMGWRGTAAWAAVMLLSAYLMYVGLQNDSAFPFALGFSVVTMGIAVFITYFGLPPRPIYTFASIFLLLFWGFAAGDRLEWIFGTLDGGEEMFFLSGVSMVTASTFFIIYNEDILLAVISRVGGAFGSILPSLRTAVAYPMANRFRTGMTLAMISLVVFALTTMSAMNLNYDKLFLQDESRGGWDIQVYENQNNRLPGIKAALEQAGDPVADEITSEGAVLIAGFDSVTEATQNPVEGYEDYPVRGLTDQFLENASVPLSKIANGYEDEAAVWEALRTEPDAAVIDGFIIESGLGPNEFSVDGIPDEDTFDPVRITVRDAVSGESRNLDVIGVIAFGASANFPGIYMGETAFLNTFGEPELALHFVAISNPDDSRDVARDIESALVTTGAQADSLQQIAEDNNALSRGFLRLMQSFMGLGLVVGIAAVGVVAFRTVVERRQQIGMLRAIGYKKSMVSLSFLMEASFVTVLGVSSGTLLGLWLAWFLVTGDDFPGEGNTFYVPWFELIVINMLTLIASVAMTIIPSRQAASVPTAEALRYE